MTLARKQDHASRGSTLALCACDVRDIIIIIIAVVVADTELLGAGVELRGYESE